MRIVELNGRNMETKESTHSYLKQKLDLPEYYGGNLDGLWDILSSHSEPLIIELYNEKELIENLGEYGHSILELLKDLSIENKNIIFRIGKNKIKMDFYTKIWDEVK